MTHYTSWISDEELLEILEDDPLVSPFTLAVLRGEKNAGYENQSQMQNRIIQETE